MTLTLPNKAKAQYLTEKLGEYLSAYELRQRAISLHTLNTWRKQNRIKSVKLEGIWYYSLNDIDNIIKTAPIEDVRRQQCH